MSTRIKSAMHAIKMIEDGEIKVGSVINSVDGLFQVVGIGRQVLIAELKEIIYDPDTDTDTLGDHSYLWTAYDFSGKEVCGL